MPDDYGSAGIAGSDDDDQEASVGLKVRALPLIELLEASARKHAHVMWDFE
jgi:hypothetical protein